MSISYRKALKNQRLAPFNAIVCFQSTSFHFVPSTLKQVKTIFYGKHVAVSTKGGCFRALDLSRPQEHNGLFSQAL